MSNRNAKVSELLMREISDILHTQYQAETVAITITGVDVSPDHRHAKVFYSLLLKGNDRVVAERFLRNVAPRVRYELGRRIVLKHMPALHFAFDESIGRGAHIDQLLDSLDISEDSGPDVSGERE